MEKLKKLEYQIDSFKRWIANDEKHLNGLKKELKKLEEEYDKLKAAELENTKPDNSI